VSAAIPAIFAVLAALCLVSVVLFTWRSLRGALGTAALGDVLTDGASARRMALLHQKNALLEDLRDLRFDHEAGKLSDADFERLEAKVRAQATAALKALDDDVAPFRASAEALIAERLGRSTPTSRSSNPPAERRSTPVPPTQSTPPVRVCPSCTVGNDPDSVFCKKCGGRLIPIPCSSCSTVNDADATFCKKCGTSLEEAARASVPPEPGT